MTEGEAQPGRRRGDGVDHHPSLGLTPSFQCRRGDFDRYPTTARDGDVRRDNVNSGYWQRLLLHETEPISDRKSKSDDFILGQSAAVRDRPAEGVEA